MAVVHLARKVFKCNASNCERKFGSKQQLEFHQRSAGHGKDKLECTYANCSKKFSSKQKLNNHAATIHSGERPFKCSNCERKFVFGKFCNPELQGVDLLAPALRL